MDSHALASLAERSDDGPRLHRALPDAEDAAALFRRLCARAAALGEEERELLETAGWDPLSVLDASEVAPDAPAPSLREERFPYRTDDAPPALPVAADGWAAEFEGTPGGNVPGLVGRLPGFELREGQVRLAAAVSGVFDGGGIGIYEAGTGSGKSLAYLLPAAFHSAATGSRVVVSTRTKALQRQLATRELPLVASALPDDWRWATLMGRENYLCRRRLDDAVAEATQMLDEGRALALAYLVGRARRGEVDLSALPYGAERSLPALSDLTRELRSSRATCTGRHCPYRRDCLWRRARSRAERAHLVCVNHALLLTGFETLPHFEDLVVDEAHLLYQEATEAYTVRVDGRGVRRLVADLASGQRSLAARLRTAARRADASAAAALEAAAAAAERFVATAPGLATAVGQTLLALAQADERARDDRDAASGRRPSEHYDLSVWLTHGMREWPQWDAFVQAAALLGETLEGLAGATTAAAEVLPEEHREHAATAGLAEEAAALAAVLAELPRLNTNDVAWAEIEAPSVTPGVRPLEWSLLRSPLVPARLIREALWDRLRSAVLTSATLTVAGSFTYFRDMVGVDADLDVDEGVLPSPFDFRRQALLVLERGAPGAGAPARVAALGERVRDLVHVTGGRTLVLFTNRRDMRAVAAMVGEHVEAQGVLVLAQGIHGSAAALSDEFRAHGESVLFGVDTLWTGQDFPGDTLVCLVIARLPFPRQDPLFRARCHASQEAGQRWFEHFYLPEAVLRFRQGFGRLIRSESDVGVVVVLDPRLAGAAYRRAFLDSLPDIEVVDAAAADVAPIVAERLAALLSQPPT